MLVSGIISKNKFMWISSFLPSNAIMTTEELPTIYVPLTMDRVWILNKNLDKELRNMNIYTDNYKLCNIENGRIKYIKIKEDRLIRGWKTWIETKDNYIKFTIEMEKYNRDLLLKIRSCQLFKRSNYSGMYYIKENGELKEKIYTLKLEMINKQFKSPYLKQIKIALVFLLLLLLKWNQEKHGNGFGI
jgi:hypothetical protein